MITPKYEVHDFLQIDADKIASIKEYVNRGLKELEFHNYSSFLESFESAHSLCDKIAEKQCARAILLLEHDKVAQLKDAALNLLTKEPDHIIAALIVRWLNVAGDILGGDDLITQDGTCQGSVRPAYESEPEFSFVMIVLNGMPFIEYSLRSIYDFAHEIIIVEGAVDHCIFAAHPDGSSRDGTVECINSFPDPKKKIRLIQGKWPEKCHMQNKALKYITGDYVWLIDSDEIYKREDLDTIKQLCGQDRSITQINFIPDSFWKGFDYIIFSPKLFQPECHFHRVFQYRPGAYFTTHRPPTMVWPPSDKSTAQMHCVDGSAMRERGIIFYHYSYVLDTQVRQKIELYNRYGWGRCWDIDLAGWYNQCFSQWTPENRHIIDAHYPIWTGDKNSCTTLFKGTHPDVMCEFMEKMETYQSVAS